MGVGRSGDKFKIRSKTMGTILTVPASSTEDLLAFAGALFTDLWPLLIIAVGIPLAFYIIGRVISTVKVASRSRK